jgi:hypothetical protein
MALDPRQSYRARYAGSESGGKVNDLIGGLLGEALPAVDLSDRDRTRRHQGA